MGPVPEVLFMDWFAGIAFTRVIWAEASVKVFRLEVLFGRRIVDIPFLSHFS